MQTGGIAALSEDAVLQRDQATLSAIAGEVRPGEPRACVQTRSRAIAAGQVTGPAERRVGGRRGPAVAGHAAILCARRPSGPCRRSVPSSMPTRRSSTPSPTTSTHPCRTPNDPDFADQYAHQLIQMEDAWDISTGSRDIVVARAGHRRGCQPSGPQGQHLGEQGRDRRTTRSTTTATATSTTSTAGTSATTTATSRRSSACPSQPRDRRWPASSAAVGNNGKGVCGVNWQCSIMVLRVSLEFHDEEVAEGLDYAAANGARVVNMSFGGDVFGPEGDPSSRPPSTTPTSRAFSWSPARATPTRAGRTIRPPIPTCMAVASTNGEDTKTGHSTFGPWVDIAAPGTDIVTTDLGGEYIATAGTSFSSPYVAAVAALVLSHRPELTHVQVRAILENTTRSRLLRRPRPESGLHRHRAGQRLSRPWRGPTSSYPLGEIVAPGRRRSFAADGNADRAVPVRPRRFLPARLPPLRPDRLDADRRRRRPDGPQRSCVRCPWPIRAPGTYELRLRVTRGDRIAHGSQALRRSPAATEQAHWPKPQDATDEDFYWTLLHGQSALPGCQRRRPQ